MTGMHEQGGLPIPNIQHISQPYWFEEGGDLDQDSFGLKVARDLEQAIVEYGIDNIAAFIAEPIQGAGGVIIPPETYWPEIQRICDDYEILFTGPNGLDKKKNVTKIGKMTGDNKINLIDFDDSISLEGYKHEI